MSEETVAVTQTILSGLVQRTPLTAKLLLKPPFRFLHDLIMEVIRNSDFASGLYSPDECQSANITEKEAKINFLQKLVDVVQLVTDETVKLKPAKVVAGLDPEETNRFLQRLGQLATEKVDTRHAVQKVTGQTMPASQEPLVTKEVVVPTPAPVPAPPLKSKSSRENLRERDKPSMLPAKSTSRTNLAATSKRNPGSRDKLTTDGSSKAETAAGSVSSSVGDLLPSRPDEERNQTTLAKKQSEPAPTPAPRPAPIPVSVPAAAAAAPEPKEQEQPIRSFAARPVTARRAPPKIKLADRELQQQEPIKEAPQVILEGSKQKGEGELNRAAATGGGGISGKEEEEEGELLVQLLSSTKSPEGQDAFQWAPQPTDPNNSSPEDHGGLVKKLLETKQQLAAGQEPGASPSAPDQISKGKERLHLLKEMQSLQANIQQLCRSTAPLGMSLDYFREDFDSMSKELDFWKSEAKRLQEVLDKEKRETATALAPLMDQLKATETHLAQKMQLIDEAKAQFYQNEESIRKLMGSFVGSAIVNAL